MKNTFWEHYQPTDEWFENLWASAHVVLDTSVLLDLYKYSSPTLTEFLSALEHVAGQGRLWMPYHVGIEYHTRRPEVVIREAKQPYDDARKIIKEVQKAADALESQAKHAVIDRQALASQVRECVSALRASIDQSEAEHPDFFVADPIRDQLAELYEGRVGQNSPNAEDADFIQMAEARYAKLQPPGFEDEGKPSNKYGDLVIWQQLKQHAVESDTSIIFVTNDAKADWWTKIGGRTMGPNSALRTEFRSETKHDFYLYSADSFLEHARSRFGGSVSEEAIAEVRQRHEMDSRVESADSEDETEFDASALREAVTNYYARQRAAEAISRSDLQRAQDDLRRAGAAWDWQPRFSADAIKASQNLAAAGAVWQNSLRAPGLENAIRDMNAANKRIAETMNMAGAQNAIKAISQPNSAWFDGWKTAGVDRIFGNTGWIEASGLLKTQRAIEDLNRANAQLLNSINHPAFTSAIEYQEQLRSHEPSDRDVEELDGASDATSEESSD